MKYFKTKHERNSARITALLMLILILLFFVMGPPYLDPPTEYGVAVNFGTTDFGRANVQSRNPIKSEPKKINEISQETPKESRPQELVTDKVEEVATQESEESIRIRKQKEAEARAKAEAERIERERREREEQKRKLDELMGGIGQSDGNTTGSEGNDNKVGDKGQPDGDPYANSYYGDPGTGSGGIGYGLNGRGSPSKTVYKQDCNQEGLVVVRIEVNKNGEVVKAEPGVKGTTNNASCLLIPAKKIALSHKWRPDSKAPSRQIGFVSVNFNLGQ